MKKLLALFLLLAVPSWGADTSPGYVFTTTDHVTSSKLNSLGAGTVNTTFFTDKSAAAIAATDTLLFYQAGVGFKKIAYGSFFTNSIPAAAEDTTPATNDFVLTYDTSAGDNKKVALNNLLTIDGRVDVGALTAPLVLNLPASSNSVPMRVSATNLVGIYPTLPFTNLAIATTTTASNLFLLWDAAAGTNKFASVASLITNAPASTTTNGSDMLLGVSAATLQPKTFKLNGLGTRKFETGLITVATGSMYDAAHSLAARPQVVQWVLVCQTADAGYAVNDEVSCASCWTTATGDPAFTSGANSTNMFLTCGDATPIIRHRTTFAPTETTAGRWVAAGYAIYYPY